MNNRFARLAGLCPARAMLAAVPILATATASALTIDFEQENPFSGGTLSTEEAFSGSQSLWVAGGQSLTYDIPDTFQGKGVIISMKVWDHGRWIDTEVPGYPGNVYGPRWGVSTGAHAAEESLGASILFRTFGGGGIFDGYGLESTDTRFNGSWFSPIHYTGSNRNKFKVPGTGGSNPGSGWVPGEGAGGEWMTWTFRVNADGSETSIQLNDLNPYTATNAAKPIGGTPTQVWLYGGRGGTDGVAYFSGTFFDDIKIFEEGSLAVIPRIEEEDVPTIDGVRDDIYLALPPQAIATLSGGVAADGPEDFSAHWYGVYDEERFYVYIDITDEHLEDTAGTDAWRNDIVEIYFNMDNFRNPAGNAQSGDNYQYSLHWNKPTGGGVSGQGSFEGVEWVQVTTENGWAVEVSWPWTTLTDRGMVEGVDFGFDIAVNDNDGNPTYDSVHYWFSKNALWGNMSTAGNVELGPFYDGNYPPSIQAIGLVEAVEGTVSTINVVVDDENSDDTITITATGLPEFATLTDNGDRTATIEIDAEAGDANIYFFTVRASDGELADTEQVTLIVRDPAVPSQSPTFPAVDPVVIDRGEAVTIDLTVTDLDSLSVTIEATALPEFATFSVTGAKTARVVIAPSSEVDPGDYTITVTATDEDENTASVDIAVNVTDFVPRTTYYLDPETGSLENDGSPENPWPSLQAVMDAGKNFGAGNTLYLRDGYHGEPTLAAANSDYVYIMPDEDATPKLSRLVFGSSSAKWHVSGLSISREYANIFSRETMVTLSGTENILTECEIFTVADTSSWTLADWNDRSSNGVSMGGSHNLLENNTILDTNFSVSTGHSSQFNIIRGNHIQRFAGDGVRALGDDTLVEYNYIADNYNVNDNHDDGIQSWSDGGSGSGSGTVHRVTLRGNVIVQTTDWNRPFIGSLQGIGLFDGMFQDWLIENNSIAVNMWHGIAVYGAINCVIRNNTVVDQDMNASPGPTWITIEPHKNYNASGNTPEQNAFYRGSGNKVINNLTTDIRNILNTAPYAELSGNIEIGANDFATYFVDYPYDLRLKQGAPAINAGVSAGAATIDADGVERPQGSGVDVGAYEWVGLWRETYPLDGQWADTGAFLGHVYVGFEPWLYDDAESWIYLDDASFSASGAWVFALDLVPADPATTNENFWAGYALEDGWAETPIGWVYPAGDWIFIESFGTWVYAPAGNLGSSGSWIYAANSNAPDPV